MPSPTSLSAVRAEALAKRDRGDLADAQSLLEVALEAAAMTSGEDHPEVLRTGHLLATIHRQSGDLPAARRVLENAIYAGGNKHGEDYPPLLAMSFDLAQIAEELGNRHEARRHYTRVARYGPATGFDEQRVRAAQEWLGPAAPPSSVPVLNQQVTLPGPTPLVTQPAQQALPHRAPVTAYRQEAPQPMPPAAPLAPASGGRGRFAVIAASAAAVVAVVAAVVTLALVLLPSRDEPPGPDRTISPDQLLPATDLALTEHDSVLVLRWKDPSKGLAAQLLVGNRIGEADKLLGQPDNGDTRFELRGLNSTWDYCFRIMTVYSQDEVRKSDQVCTNRSAKPSPAR